MMAYICPISSRRTGCFLVSLIGMLMVVMSAAPAAYAASQTTTQSGLVYEAASCPATPPLGLLCNAGCPQHGSRKTGGVFRDPLISCSIGSQSAYNPNTFWNIEYRMNCTYRPFGGGSNYTEPAGFPLFVACRPKNPPAAPQAAPAPPTPAPVAAPPPIPVQAAAPHELNKPPATCTTDPQFNIEYPSNNNGIMTSLLLELRQDLDAFVQSLFYFVKMGLISDISIALTVYIMIYAISFTLGIIQVTMQDFVIRMLKVGIIALLLSGDGWSAIGGWLVTFFTDGTDSLIMAITSTIGPFTGVMLPTGGTPFLIVDYMIMVLTSGKLFIAWLAMTFTGPYGPIFAIITGMALFSLVKAVVTAIWVYLMALILRTLLIGMAPLFIACMLFNRTRHLFDGWLNQILNTVFQPVLLFTFFTFFALLMYVAIQNLLVLPVCWTEARETLRGSPFYMHFWRFELMGGPGGWEPYGGNWSWIGAEDGVSPAFPISIMSILILFLLGDLANRFNSVVLMVASDLASSSVKLSDFENGFGGWFSPIKQGVFGGAAGKEVQRNLMHSGLGRVPGAGGRAGGIRGGTPPTTGNPSLGELAASGGRGHSGTIIDRLSMMSSTRGGGDYT